VKDSRLAFSVNEVLRMNEQELCMRSVGTDQASPPAGITERPLRICVVFDDDVSAQSVEVLIRHVALGYECDTQSFRFDELDRPAPVVAAARSASDSDILVLAVRDDQMLPSLVKSWLGLCIGLRDDDQEGALVVLIEKTPDMAEPGSLLLEYLETVAAIGGLAFFSRGQNITERFRPRRQLLELRV
jgi:hypothetical protein